MTTAMTPAVTGSARQPGPAAAAATTVALRPGCEGANIRTWVGFKHFMYLAEEGVLEWFRVRGLGPATLFHHHGLALSIVESSVQLSAVLDLDDVVDAEVSGGPARFGVRLVVRRPGAPVVLRGRVLVVLTPVGEAPTSAPDVVADAVGQIADLAPAAGAAADIRPGGAAVAWAWRVPYYYCQFSRQLRHSGYVRILEEAVDRFLDERGLSVGTMLARRGWIPVVSRARVTQVAEVGMEETVHIRFAVTDVVKGIGFDARMDCHVERDGVMLPVATASILHGYAIARGDGAGRLAELDPATIRALLDGGPS